jgi:hypothetical protein
MKIEDVPVTGCKGPYGFETLRLAYFLDSWLTDGGEVVGLTHGQCFIPLPLRQENP